MESMTNFNHQYIQDYLDYVKSNPNLINRERHDLIKNIILPTLERKDVFFDVETYENALDYCERRYYELFPYQKFIYAFVFMYEDANRDMPIFRTFFIMMGRGNGKDGCFIPLMNFFQTPYYGVKNYHVDIVATSEDQAINSFNVSYSMLEENKKTMKKHFYWNKVEIIGMQTRSSLRFNTSNAKTKDGKQSGAILFNEYHGYEDYDSIKVFQSGLGKIKHPRIFIITTQGTLRDGPLDEILAAIKGVLSGEPNTIRYFPFICKLDDSSEVDDEKLWEKANPSLNYMPILKSTMQVDYEEMKTSPSKKQEFMTKRMNIPQRDESIAITTWENILRSSYSDIENKIPRETTNLLGRDAICGIDFASFQDFTSAGFLFKDGEEYIYRSMTWICKQSKFFSDIKFPFENAGSEGYQDFVIIDEPYIREEMVVDWIVEEMKEYNVLKFVMDSHRFMGIRHAFEKHGLEEETRTNKSGMVRKIRLPGSVYNIVIPVIEREFTKGSLNFGNSAISRWSINNTAIKTTGINLAYIKQEEKLRKNDTYMAFVHAFSAKELLEENDNVYYI